MCCFYHGDVEAVALCKSCGRGICHECCADVENSSACRNRCEQEVAAQNDIIERNKTAYQKASGAYVRSGVFLVVLGAVFGALGILVMSHDGEPSYFMVVMGGLFVIYGLSQFFTAKRYSAK